MTDTNASEHLPPSIHDEEMTTSNATARQASDTLRLVLEGVVGSTAYGLTTPASDVDRLGVFQARLDEVLSLRAHEVTTSSRVSHDPDFTLHELAKFASLALKANPTVTELLWLEHYDVRDDVGDALVAARSSFLSTSSVRNAYGGYAIAQAKRLARRHEEGRSGFSSTLRNRTEKHGRHCFRLLVMARDLLATGELVLDQRHRRDELFAMGELAATDPDAFHERFADELRALDATDSVLADQPDRDAVAALVLQARHRDI